MPTIKKNILKAAWSVGNEKETVQLEFTYDLSNVKKSIEKKSITVELKGEQSKVYKLTSAKPSFDLVIPKTENHFGMDGKIVAELLKGVVYFEGKFIVNEKECPPPPPMCKMVLFNFNPNSI